MRLKMPAPETHIADHPLGFRLFADLQRRQQPAVDPFYVSVRLILPGPRTPGVKRSWWLAWIIDEQRMARSWDAIGLLPELKEWITEHMAQEFPSIEAVHGVTAEEADAMRAERDAALAGRQKSRA